MVDLILPQVAFLRALRGYTAENLQFRSGKLR